MPLQNTNTTKFSPGAATAPETQNWRKKRERRKREKANMDWQNYIAREAPSSVSMGVTMYNL
jgi:hypothetical protein